ncbi:MAG: META domain-containing protein [Litoreibacter sp.]|uniref:META domain-containing protein n=1 Tax=Litoreibacter sp. TaxID=1969459 RepID=UPI003297C9D6
MKYIALIALTLLAYCKDETISGYAEEDVVWQLKTVNDLPFPANATITFPEAGKIAGQAPCNRYFGEQTAPYPWFQATAIGSTKKACPELDAETAYFDALRAMTLSEAVGETLILSTDDGQEMVFKAVTK